MKPLRLLLPITITLLALMLLMTACNGSNPSETTNGNVETTTTSPTTTAPISDLVIVDNSESEYIIYRDDKADKTSIAAGSNLKNAIKDKYGCNIKYTIDFVKDESNVDQFDGLKEILVGHTNRKESAELLEGLGELEYIVKATDNKIVIIGKTSKGPGQAVGWFINNCFNDNNTLTVPGDLYYKGTIDYNYCEATNMNYDVMASEIYNAFIKNCFVNGWFRTSYSHAGFWDGAEMFETIIDAYEATGNENHLKNLHTTAKYLIKAHGTDWSYNQYNDDVVWMSIAFVRAYLLTGEKTYLTYAKSNFDMVYRRGWDSTLGGGIWWKNDEKVGKNACVNGPAAIAACYLAKATNDDKYYEIAKKILDWEIKNLYCSDGAIDDNIIITNERSTYHSTYNQGTFIGACTLVHEKYGDQAYLDYAEKAATFVRTRMTTGGVIDSNETHTADLIGFKGILVRWLYRYGEYTNNIEILTFLQSNAATAYSNKNAKGLIWTSWKDKTSDDIKDYGVFGLSTAVSLMYNCLPYKE